MAIGADISTSEDLTGEGGDWDLEYQVGNVETTSLQFNNYHGTLLTEYSLQQLFDLWQDGTPDDLNLGTDIRLNLNDNLALSGVLNVANTSAGSLQLSATNLAAIVGRGANTFDNAADDVGFAFSNLGLNFTLNSDLTYNYSLDLSGAGLAIRGLEFLTVDSITAAGGNQSSTSLTINNATLKVGDFFNLSGSMAYQATATTTNFSATGVNAFIGNNQGTATTTDDVGLGLSNVNFALISNADATYSYNLTNANVALVGINNLSLSTTTVSATGDNSQASVAIGAFSLDVANNAAFSGNNLNFVKDATGTRFEGSAINAFVGNNQGNINPLDDVGMSLSNAGLNLAISSTGTYTYNLTNASAALVGIPNLTLAATNISANGDATSTNVNIGTFTLDVNGNAKLSGTALTFTNNASGI
ncbi:MAG: DUF4347 domain-containing protein, partial [Synechococcaceae cyanobacterium RL_1_2]|nr:DUF4347 domain-containing protein [Synechococcaceae cyanobacterium RL_1_2]